MNISSRERLAVHPLDLTRLPKPQRGEAIVSHVIADNEVVVVSRVRDPVWELWMYQSAPNLSPSHLSLDFRDIPKQFVSAVQDIYYRWLKAGMNGRPPPVARTLVTSFGRIKPFLRWLNERGVRRLSEVTSLHASAYAKRVGREIEASSLGLILLEINRL